MIMRMIRRQSRDGFRTRSPDRDREMDVSTLGAVAKAIDEATAIMQRELEGLKRRLVDTQDRASMAAGTDHAEYLTREPAQLSRLRKYEDQMRQATARLKVLEEDIANLCFVRATFYSRFNRLNSFSTDKSS